MYERIQNLTYVKEKYSLVDHLLSKTFSAVREAEQKKTLSGSSKINTPIFLKTKYRKCKLVLYRYPLRNWYFLPFPIDAF